MKRAIDYAIAGVIIAIFSAGIGYASFKLIVAIINFYEESNAVTVSFICVAIIGLIAAAIFESATDE